MSGSEPQLEEDMSSTSDYFFDDAEFQKLIPEIDASIMETVAIGPTSSAVINCLNAEKNKVKHKRRYVACSICGLTKRSDHLNRHMKTHEVSDASTRRTVTIFQSKTVQTKVKPRSNYRRHVVCCICERVMRSDHLKRHMCKMSHTIPKEVDTDHGAYIEKLSKEIDRKHNNIMSTIPEQYLAIKKNYSLDTYLRLCNEKI